MTQHRDLAAAIRRAVFDRIESDRTLVSCNVEQAIEDALILHAAGRSGPLVDVADPITAAAAELINAIVKTILIDVQPRMLQTAIYKLRDRLLEAGIR